ncbi:MAG: response regulator transcription factor [Elusimicrobia bacterium]|nr:response regulator transcription factor [Elusimicrobiota bacterium]
MKARLLITEPEGPGRKPYRLALAPEEFDLRFEASGERCLECAFEWAPSCVLLDIELPGIGGLETCRILKSDPRTRRIPVLFVSANAGKAEIVAGLKSGADDFLAKPFHPTELLWRVRALLRRYQSSAPSQESVLEIGPIRVDSEQGLAQVSGRAVRLTPKEFALLETFMRRPERVIKRSCLLETVWGYDSAVRPRVVDLTLFRLRRKLGEAGLLLETLPGFGYRLRKK